MISRLHYYPFSKKGLVRYAIENCQCFVVATLAKVFATSTLAAFYYIGYSCSNNHCFIHVAM